MGLSFPKPKVFRRKKETLPGRHSDRQWRKLCKLFEGKCARCGKKRKLTKDHIVPVSWSESSDWITNIQPLCGPCNSTKNNFSAADYRPDYVKEWAEKEVK